MQVGQPPKDKKGLETVEFQNFCDARICTGSPLRARIHACRSTAGTMLPCISATAAFRNSSPLSFHAASRSLIGMWTSSVLVTWPLVASRTTWPQSMSTTIATRALYRGCASSLRFASGGAGLGQSRRLAIDCTMWSYWSSLQYSWRHSSLTS